MDYLYTTFKESTQQKQQHTCKLHRKLLEFVRTVVLIIIKKATELCMMYIYTDT